MAQPDNYGFSEEASLLKDSARKFFKNNFSTDKLHRMVADNSDSSRASESLWNKQLWQQLLELGWTLLAVPESAEGLGLPAVAVAGLVEEAGRAAFPCPLLATLNATYVLAACGDSGNAALKEIEGEQHRWQGAKQTTCRGFACNMHPYNSKQIS